MTGLTMRRYDHERDLDAVQRIWREVGWIDSSEAQAGAVATLFSIGKAWVNTVDDVAECAVHVTPGSFRWGNTDLPLQAVTAVTTSHIVRKRGAATNLVAEALADGAESGMAVAALGIFDQGYYDRFGFGTCDYEHVHEFDPSALTVPIPARLPVRLSRDDAGAFHDLMVRRHRGHGSVVLDPPQNIEAELAWSEKFFGLGFRAGDGRLTHALLGEMDGEHGPYKVNWMAYEEPAQVLELLGVIRSLEDQVNLVKMLEPAELQLQDLLHRPIRHRNSYVLAGDKVNAHSGLACYQVRALDLPACVAAVEWEAEPVEFTAEVSDPLAGLGGRWPGVGGTWRVHLGEKSWAEPTAAVPELTATVNAFTRMWIGARPATGLALTGDVTGPPDLLTRIDRVLRLPPARVGWSF